MYTLVKLNLYTFYYHSNYSSFNNSTSYVCRSMNFMSLRNSKYLGFPILSPFWDLWWRRIGQYSSSILSLSWPSTISWLPFYFWRIIEISPFPVTYPFSGMISLMICLFLLKRNNLIPLRFSCFKNLRISGWLAIF